MFSMCSELTPRACVPDARIPQFMQPWEHLTKPINHVHSIDCWEKQTKKGMDSSAQYVFYRIFSTPDLSQKKV